MSQRLVCSRAAILALLVSVVSVLSPAVRAFQAGNGHAPQRRNMRNMAMKQKVRRPTKQQPRHQQQQQQQQQQQTTTAFQGPPHDNPPTTRHPQQSSQLSMIVPSAMDAGAILDTAQTISQAACLGFAAFCFAQTSVPVRTVPRGASTAATAVKKTEETPCTYEEYRASVMAQNKNNVGAGATGAAGTTYAGSSARNSASNMPQAAAMRSDEIPFAYAIDDHGPKQQHQNSVRVPMPDVVNGISAPASSYADYRSSLDAARVAKHGIPSNTVAPKEPLSPGFVDQITRKQTVTYDTSNSFNQNKAAAGSNPKPEPSVRTTAAPATTFVQKAPSPVQASTTRNARSATKTEVPYASGTSTYNKVSSPAVAVKYNDKTSTKAPASDRQPPTQQAAPSIGPPSASSAKEKTGTVGTPAPKSSTVEAQAKSPSDGLPYQQSSWMNGAAGASQTSFAPAKASWKKSSDESPSNSQPSSGSQASWMNSGMYAKSDSGTSTTSAASSSSGTKGSSDVPNGQASWTSNRQTASPPPTPSPTPATSASTPPNNAYTSSNAGQASWMNGGASASQSTVTPTSGGVNTPQSSYAPSGKASWMTNGKIAQSTSSSATSMNAGTSYDPNSQANWMNQGASPYSPASATPAPAASSRNQVSPTGIGSAPATEVMGAKTPSFPNGENWMNNRVSPSTKSSSRNTMMGQPNWMSNRAASPSATNAQAKTELMSAETSPFLNGGAKSSQQSSFSPVSGMGDTVDTRWSEQSNWASNGRAASQSTRRANSMGTHTSRTQRSRISLGNAITPIGDKMTPSASLAESSSLGWSYDHHHGQSSWLKEPPASKVDTRGLPNWIKGDQVANSAKGRTSDSAPKNEFQ